MTALLLHFRRAELRNQSDQIASFFVRAFVCLAQLRDVVVVFERRHRESIGRLPRRGRRLVPPGVVLQAITEVATRTSAACVADRAEHRFTLMIAAGVGALRIEKAANE